jgi:HAE1 family hydrophobic/amphiphilic exporter-1
LTPAQQRRAWRQRSWLRPRAGIELTIALVCVARCVRHPERAANAHLPVAVRERLDAARSQLPERADRPTLLTSDPGERPIAVLAIKQSASQAAKDSRAQGGGDLRSLARTATEVHARRLEQIEGVSSVAVVGAPDDEIRVELDPEKLRALDLTPEDVAAAIRAENATGAGGTIRKGQFRFSVRALTEFRNPSEILDTPIGRVGAGITLRDVGTVSLGLADPQTLTRLDGTSAIGMVVYKDAGSNTVAVTRRMTDAIAQLEKEFPGVSMTVVAAQADFVVDALSNLGQEIVAGGLLSLLVIFVFLRDWRLSLAIGVTVPLSVLMALVALQALDVSINVLSLGGLALGTGLLVDTAIVVAESVGRRREEGMSLLEAAVTGKVAERDVLLPAVAAILQASPAEFAILKKMFVNTTTPPAMQMLSAFGIKLS